jgi:hypothetical protein
MSSPGKIQGACPVPPCGLRFVHDSIHETAPSPSVYRTITKSHRIKTTDKLDFRNTKLRRRNHGLMSDMGAVCMPFQRVFTSHPWPFPTPTGVRVGKLRDAAEDSRTSVHRSEDALATDHIEETLQGGHPTQSPWLIAGAHQNQRCRPTRAKMIVLRTLLSADGSSWDMVLALSNG